MLIPSDKPRRSDFVGKIVKDSQKHVGRQDITVGAQPNALAFDGTSVWVTNQGSGTVSKLLASDGSIQGTFRVRGTPSAAVSVGTILWVASMISDSQGGSLTALGPNGLIIRALPVQQQPIALTSVQLDLPEPILYFVDLNSDKLFRMDPTTGVVDVVGTIGGLSPQALLFDGTNFWICNSADNSVSKMVPWGRLLGTFPVGKTPDGLAFDGNNVWVANFDDNTVTKLRANDGQILQTIATGTNPGGIAFDGANVWVANFGSNTLTKIRARDGAVLDTLATGLSPVGIVFDGAHIWVTNSGSNTVSKF
jgi:DNA-binding beta-propeller fold protein YncE